jgi:hypothetical protein
VTRTFLWLHSLGWMAFCVSAYLNVLPTLAPGQHGPMLAAKSLRTAIGCVLSAVLYVGILRLRRANPPLPLPLLLAAVIVSAGVFGAPSPSSVRRKRSRTHSNPAASASASSLSTA